MVKIAALVDCVMEITMNKSEQKLTMKIAGRIDTTTAPEFEAKVSEIGDINELVLDFADVEYISSAGLRVILKAQKLMNTPGKMKLINVSDDVSDVFDITGFTDFLTIEKA